MKRVVDNWLGFFVIAVLAAILPGTAAAQIRYFEGHQRPIQAVIYTSDGKQIITASSDRTIKIWDRATGKIVRSIATGDTAAMALAVTRDGRRLYAADFGGTVRVYEVPRPYPLSDPLSLSTPPTAVTQSADNALMVTGGSTGAVRLWNLATTPPSPRDFGGFNLEVTALAIVDKSKVLDASRRPPAEKDKGMDLVAAFADGSLTGWKTDATGAQVSQVPGLLFAPRLSALAISRDGTMVGGGEDGLLRVFHWPPGTPVTFPQHGSQVNAIELSPDGKLIASGGIDQRVMLSEAASGKLIRTLEGGQYSLNGQSIAIGPVEAVAFSRDSQLVAAGGAAGIVRLWNVDGSDRYLLSGQTGAVHGVAVHPDGKQIASAGADGTIRLWDLPTPPAILAPPTQTIQAFTLSADGKTAVLALADGSVQVWPMPGPKAELPAKPAAGSPAAAKPLRVEVPEGPTAVAIARTGRWLAAGDSKGQIRLADSKDGKVQAILGAHTGPITALAFHPDSSRLLSAGQDGAMKLWDLTTPAPLRLAENKQPIPAVAIASDGTFAVSGGADGGIRQYDCGTGRPIRTLAEPGTAANPPGSPGAVPAVTALALSADDSLLAAAGDNGAVRLWTTTDGAQKPSLVGHLGAVPGLAFSPKGDRIASAGADGAVRVWRLPVVPVALAANTRPVQTLAISPDGRLAVFGGEGGEVRLWNLAEGKAEIELKGHAAAVKRAVFRPDGGEVATADAAGNICFWNTADGGRQDLLAAHEGAVTSLVYLPGGKQIVSGGADGVLRLWQLSLPPPAKPGEEPMAKASAMLISAGAKTLGWGAADGTVTLLDRASGKTKATLKGRGVPVSAIGLSLDETLVAIGDEDGKVRVAQVADGKEPLILPGHKGRVAALAFHPKDTLLASAGADGTVCLWRPAVLRKALADPAARARLLAPKPEKPAAPKPGSAPAVAEEPALAQIVPVHPSGASSVVFTPDGSRLFCGAADKQVRVWNVDQLAVKGQPNPPGPTNTLAHSGAVTCIGLSQDGQTLFAGAADNTIRLWNAGNSQVLVDLKQSAPVRGVAVSPDGTRLATVAEDGAIYVWNPKTQRPLQRFSTKPGSVLGLTFLGDNKTLLAGDAAGSLREYPISAVNLLVADAGKVSALALMPDGKSLASGGDDGTVKLWEVAQLAAGPTDLNSPPAPKQRFQVGSHGVVAIAIRGDGRMAAAVSGEGLFLQNVSLGGGQGSSVAVPLPPAGTPPPKGGPIVIKDLAYSPDGSRLAVVAGDGQVRFYNSLDGRKLEDMPVPAAASCVAFLGKDNRLAAGAADGRLYGCQPSLLWADFGPGTPVTSVTYSADGATVVAGGGDGSIRLMKAANGSSIKSQPGSGGAIVGLTMTADGTRVVAGNSDQNVRIYLLGGTQTVTPLAQGSQVRALALCRDGRRLLVATDDRDFPVRVWDVVSGRELERTGGRGSPVLALAVAADNKTYVAGNADGTTWLRTLEVRKAIISEKEKVLGAAFSADGKTVISCGDTPGVKVWDAEGALLRTFTDPKTARTSSEPAFRCIAVSPDGRLVAGADSSPGPGNRALIWDAADGKLLNTITGQTSVSCLAFSPDSQKLAVGSADQQLRIFRAGDALLLERFTVPAGLAAVAFAPDNVTLAVAAGNSTVALRCCLQRVLAGHQADVTSVHYLPDGKSLLSSGVDKTVRLWDVQEAKQTATLLVGSGTIGGIALSRDGRRFVTADADHVARVWELDRLAGGRGDGPVLGPDHANLAPAGGPTQPHVSVPLTGGKGPAADAPRRESGPAPLAAFVHSKPVRGVSISADGNRVATGCEDGSARIWDTATGKELERTAASPGNLSCVAFNLDATAILSGGVNGTVIRSDCCVTRSVDAHRGPIRGLRFAPDGSLFSAGEDKSLVRWSTRSWKVVQRYAPAAEAIRWMALSPCGRFVAAGEGPRVRLWNAADGQLIATVETPAVVTGLALGVGGGKLLVAGADKIIRNYAVLQNEGKYVCSLTHQTQEMPKAIGGLVLADDGSTLYSFCSDNTVPRWFMAAGPVRFAWAAHKGPIYGLRLGLDDTRLATAGADRAARIFNAADGKLVTALPEHGDRVMDVAFSNDGKQLATCGLDKTIRVFDAAGKLTKAVSDGIDGPLYTLAMAPPSGQFGQVLLAVAGPARTVQWWSPPADPPLRTLTGHNDAIYRVLFSPNGGRLATLDYSGGLLIWDTGGTLQYWQQLPVTAAYSMATAPEGQELAVATQDPRLLVITLPGGIW